MLAFVALIHPLPTRGRIVYPIHYKERNELCKESLCINGEKKMDTRFWWRI
jgi:hypothetical protein